MAAKYRAQILWQMVNYKKECFIIMALQEQQIYSFGQRNGRDGI